MWLTEPSKGRVRFAGSGLCQGSPTDCGRSRVLSYRRVPRQPDTPTGPT
jgi:hypothetical protein